MSVGRNHSLNATFVNSIIFWIVLSERSEHLARVGQDRGCGA